MPLDTVAKRADELATKVGPLETLLALARLEDALEHLDNVLGGTPEDESAHDSEVIDLREVHEVMERVEPVLAQAEVRLRDLRSALEGR